MPTAFSMCLGIPLDDILKELGHDGSDVVWPTRGEPYCRRGFTLQELIHYSWKQGFYVIPFELIVVQINRYLDEHVVIDGQVAAERLSSVMESNVGVVTGIINDADHACAWDGTRLLCPTGLIYPIRKMDIDTFYCVVPKQTALGGFYNQEC